MQSSEHAKKVVQCLNELVPTLQEVAENTAVFLQEGNLAHGYRELQSLIEALQHFEGGLSFLHTAGFLRDTRLGHLKEKLHQVYPSILAALQEQDSVRLADVLQYELAQTLATYRSGGDALDESGLGIFSS